MRPTLSTATLTVSDSVNIPKGCELQSGTGDVFIVTETLDSRTVAVRSLTWFEKVWRRMPTKFMGCIILVNSSIAGFLSLFTGMGCLMSTSYWYAFGCLIILNFTLFTGWRGMEMSTGKGFLEF